MEDMKVQPKRPRRELRVPRLTLGKLIGWVDEERNDSRHGDDLMQQLELLRRNLHIQRGHARDVAARSAQAGDQSKLDWVARGLKYDRNCCGRCLGGESCRGANGHNHGYLATDQIDRER